MRLLQTLVPFFALAVLACSATSPAGPGGASSDEIDRCKKGCDKMKFFDCNSAEDHAACYSDCNAATPAQIEVFEGCAENSICDAECRTQITPKKPATEGDGGTSGGQGVAAGPCAAACEKLVGCNFIPVGSKASCASECETKGYQSQVDCITNTACEAIEKTCGGPNLGDLGSFDAGGIDTSVSDCQSECDNVQFFDCASAEEHSACRDQCTTASKTTRETFTSCSQGKADCAVKKDCLDVFMK